MKKIVHKASLLGLKGNCHIEEELFLRHRIQSRWTKQKKFTRA